MDELTISLPVSWKRSEQDALMALGAELLHVRVPAQRSNVPVAVGIQKSFARVPTGTPAPRQPPGTRTTGYLPVRFFKPWELRQQWPRIMMATSIPPGARQGGYLIVRGFGGTEIWRFEGASGSSLLGVRRGVLGTPTAVTALLPVKNVIAFFAPRFSVRVVRGGLLDSEPQRIEPAHSMAVSVPLFEVREGGIGGTALAGVDWPISEGYARIDDGDPRTADRIVAFVGRNRLILDQISRRPILTLTGCFGTVRGQAIRGSVINIPFRYYDRYVIQGYTVHAQHFTRTIRSPGAFWRRISWEHAPEAYGSGGRLGPPPRICVLVRFDSEPQWYAKPTNKPGGLYFFSDPVPPEGFLLNRRADEIGIRILFFWPEGAYGGTRQSGFSDTWKTAPRLRSLVVEYQERSGVLERRELVQ